MNNSSITLLQKDIQALQDYLDYRTQQEHIAIDLMSEMRYAEAMEVLARLDYLKLEDFL